MEVRIRDRRWRHAFEEFFIVLPPTVDLARLVAEQESVSA